MGILSHKNNPDKWKEKYFHLLDECEDTEKTQQTKEDLLCKTIIRLSLATTGLNKALDPHLLHLRTQLKKGLNNAQLKSELDEFSNVLMRLDESPTEELLSDASLLFNFLFHYFPQQKKEIQHIEAKYEKHGYANSQYLIIAINDLIDSIQHIEPVADQPAKIDNPPLESLDSAAIKIQLQLLLDVTEIPTIFESQTEQLKDKLNSNTAIKSILDETLSLLFKIKKHRHLEQQEMAEFLAQLTEQLTELGITASGVKSVSEYSSTKRNLLDQSVSTQMLDLQNSSKQATKLEPLKQLIYSRLDDIAQQIKKNQTLEHVEREKTSQALNDLTKKINKMEQESSALNSKLEAANKLATHDPLTGLANRLAYDERLTIEIARWNRYKSPLCLLIWDVDLFKKINDSFGHKAGDKTLILIAKLLSHHCRKTDFISRFGGEEFVMLLPNTDAKAALQSANKLREVIEKTAFNSNGKKISITISCGIAQLMEGDSAGTAFTRADKALYQAKNNGRNQCVIQ